MPITSLLFPDRLRAHLAAYKWDTLGVEQEGTWSRNGKPYPHILPRDRLELNFLPPLRAEISEFLAKHPEIRLHQDAHHLNSSQVMCINLMYPAVVSADVRAVISKLLRLPSSIEVLSGAFEYVPDCAEGTNFDFVAECSDGSRLLWEFKLTETDFGTATNDTAHQAKLADVYTARLQQMVEPRMLEPNYFFAQYQLLRNLSHLRAADTLLLALPRAHTALAERATLFANELRPDVHARVRIVYLEELAEAMAKGAEHDERLQSHFQAFTVKYLPSA